jgi:tRNA A-37 threonylcarbamoyl transferase component Bud32
MSPVSPDRATRAARLRQRLLWGLPIVSSLQVLIGLAAARFFPEVQISVWLLGFGIAILSNLVLWGIWFGLPRHAPLVGLFLIPATPVAIAVLALGTGGFASPWAFAILGLWFFWLAIVQFRARLLAMMMAIELACLVLALRLGGAHPSREAIPAAAITLFVGVLCLVSAAARDHAERGLRRAIQAQDELKAQLEAQVRERSLRIDELAVQLQNRVRERSRALARALDGIRAREISAGSVIDGRVEVLRLLGRGGMGVVYLGMDRVTATKVVVKLIQPGLSDEEGIRRFLREAEIVSTVNDPGIVRTNHVDVTEEGQLYQVMDYVEGATLLERLKRGSFTVGEAARISAALARAVAAAHQAGIIHRDIKPANVMLSEKAPGVRVLDFGISKLVGEGAQSVTEARQVMGTPSYMAPEQIRRSAEVTPAVDIFSIGVVLFEMLTGERPFSGSTPGEILEAHLHQGPRLLDRPRFPARLASLVERCLDKSPESRPSAHDLFLALTEVADSEHAASAEVIVMTGSAPPAATVDPLDATARR